jgi:hypothetical protein
MRIVPLCLETERQVFKVYFAILWLVLTVPSTLQGKSSPAPTNNPYAAPAPPASDPYAQPPPYSGGGQDSYRRDKSPAVSDTPRCRLGV